MNVQYIRHLMHGQPTVVKVQADVSQTIVPGDLVCNVAGYAQKASSSVHTLVMGIALDAVTTASATHAELNVLLVDEFSVLRLADTGTDAAQANVFTTAYDINDSQEINFGDTVNGFLIPVALPDAAKTGYTDVVVKASALWNA